MHKNKRMKPVKIGGLPVGSGGPAFIAGPCVIESRELVYEIAEFLSGLAGRGYKIIMKLSYDKANRTSVSSFRGPGIDEGMSIISDVKKRWSLPVITDVHSAEEALQAGDTADAIQIPAFLCRQTSLIQAAGKTGLPVNIKKGQFMSPYSMPHQADKALSAGASGVIFTERGSFFGYGDLVVDMRGIVVMRKAGYPVIFDATHSQQKPASSEEETGGGREFVLPMVRSALAAGADGVFSEIHPRPDEALSDRDTQLNFGLFEELLNEVSQMQGR